MQKFPVSDQTNTYNKLTCVKYLYIMVIWSHIKHGISKMILVSKKTLVISETLNNVIFVGHTQQVR